MTPDRTPETPTPQSTEMEKLLEHVMSYAPNLLKSILRDLDTASGSNTNKTRNGAAALIVDDLPQIIAYTRTLEAQVATLKVAGDGLRETLTNLHPWACSMRCTVDSDGNHAKPSQECRDIIQALIAYDSILSSIPPTV